MTVVHLRRLEKQNEEYAELQKQSQINGKEGNSADGEAKSYRLGYQACCHDIGRFLEESEHHHDVSKDRLLEHLRERKQKLFQPGNGDDPPDVKTITPTRLSDGRLALVFSPSCSWLPNGMDFPLLTSSSSPSLTFHSNPVPATPPSSPAQVIVAQPSSADLANSNVWRPWF